AEDGLDLLLRVLDAGVLVRLVGRLDDHVLRVLVPVLAELAAAHADDGDLVADGVRLAHCRRKLRPAPRNCNPCSHRGALAMLPSRSRSQIQIHRPRTGTNALATRSPLRSSMTTPRTGSSGGRKASDRASTSGASRRRSLVRTATIGSASRYSCARAGASATRRAASGPQTAQSDSAEAGRSAAKSSAVGTMRAMAARFSSGRSAAMPRKYSPTVLSSATSASSLESLAHDPIARATAASSHATMW